MQVGREQIKEEHVDEEKVWCDEGHCEVVACCEGDADMQNKNVMVPLTVNVTPSMRQIRDSSSHTVSWVRFATASHRKFVFGFHLSSYMGSSTGSLISTYPTFLIALIHLTFFSASTLLTPALARSSLSKTSLSHI
jgi:hypothetical protein